MYPTSLSKNVIIHSLVLVVLTLCLNYCNSDTTLLFARTLWHNALMPVGKGVFRRRKYDSVYGSPEPHPPRILSFLLFCQPIHTRPVCRTSPCTEAALSGSEHILHSQRPYRSKNVVWIHGSLRLEGLPKLRRLSPIWWIKVSRAILVFRVRVLAIRLGELNELACDGRSRRLRRFASLELSLHSRSHL